MRLSNYNIYYPIKEKKKIVLYNTLSKALLIIDERSIEHLRKITEDENLRKLDLYKVLEQNGFILKANVDESKIFRVVYNQIKYHSGVLLTSIMTTYNCNLNCEFCYEKGLKTDERKISMSRNTADRVIKFIKKMNSQRHFKELFILWYGGEPFLNPKIIKYILNELDLYTKNIGIKFRNHVWTNGTLVSKKLIQDISPYGMSFQVSLNGPQNEHDKKMRYKNGQGTFNRIINTIGLLKDHKLQFIIRINVDKDNCESITLLLDYLKSKFGKHLKVAFYPVLPLTGPCYESCIYENAVLGKEEQRVISELWNSAINKGFDLTLPPLGSCIGCLHLLPDSYVISPLGEVYTCVTTVAYKDSSKHRLGVISENGDLHNINWSYLYKWLSIDPLEKSECSNCRFLTECGGYCPLFSYEFLEYGKGNRTCPVLKQNLYKRILFSLEEKYHIRSKLGIQGPFNIN